MAEPITTVEKRTVITTTLRIPGSELVEMIRHSYPLLTRDTRITLWVDGGYGGDINLTDGDTDLQVVIVKEEVERS
jgi:hypothetical protein